MAGRLICVGSAIVDVALAVPHLPAPGGDVEGRSIGLIAAGATNVMTAAVRHGMRVVYAGSHGTGVLGELVRRELAALGVELALPQDAERDTGFTVALTLTELAGERSFATPRGSEARISDGDLDRIRVSRGDWVYVSGYALLPSRNGAESARWVAALPAEIPVVFDPGPLALDIKNRELRAVLTRADWLSAAVSEARSLSGVTDAREAARALSRGRQGALVRVNAAGCMLGQAGEVSLIESIDVEVVDTNGAGDVHIGAFIAALARGVSPGEAVRIANAAAALKVASWGPTAAPTLAETLAALGE